MADVKISDLSATSAVDGDSLFEIETPSGPASEKSTGAQILAYIAAALTSAFSDSVAGLVEKATDGEVRSAASNKGLTSDLIESASALVALTDAAPVAVDWDAGINFSLTVAASREIGNPTNGQPGTYRTILVQGDDATDRTITFGNQFLGTVPTITDCDTDRWYLLTIRCITSTHFAVSSQKVKGT